MAWKESDILADLAANFKAVSPNIITYETDDKGVTAKVVNVFEVTLVSGIRPTATNQNINYYVYHAGQPDEEAYYHPTVLSRTPVYRMAMEAKFSELELDASISGKLRTTPLPPITISGMAIEEIVEG